jgi:hypothetical protein
MPIAKKQPKKHDPSEFKWSTVIDHNGYRCAIIAPTQSELEKVWTKLAPAGTPINWNLVQKVRITQRHD